jgi:hypothetical protein
VTGGQLLVGETGPAVVLRAVVGSVSLTEFRYDLVSGLMTGFRSWDSTDPLYQLSSELELVGWPDFNAVLAPRLSVERRGRDLVFFCPGGGGRIFSIDASRDGGPWTPVGRVTDQISWETALDTGPSAVFFRLRP